MSRSEWEEGSIRLPAGSMKNVRAAVVAAHNASRMALFEAAQKILVQVRTANKGKRNVKWEQAITTAAYDARVDAYEVVWLLLPTRKMPLPTTGAYTPKWTEVRATKPSTPKKSNLGLLGAREKSVEADLATITFHDDGRTVTWAVSENNHACESSRAHPVGRAFFKALGQVVWKRGSGGEIVGNDEYNGDDRRDGGGSNYVTTRFGPKSKAEEKSYSFSAGWR